MAVLNHAAETIFIKLKTFRISKNATMEKSKSFWKLAVLIAAILVTSCSYDEGNDTPSTNAERIMKDDGQNPDETVFRNIPFARAFRGYVYIEGNEPALNLIHIYEHDQDGQLTYLGKVSSGGAGNGSFLGSQGALVLSPDKKILYAVNAGSNSISSFEVGDDGMLTLLNTTNSLGQTPVSLAIHNDWLYAVHLGNGTINGFY